MTNPFNRVSLQERVDFTKNLQMMLQNGIPVNEALASLTTEMKSRKLGVILARVKASLETGTSLSEAFGKERDVFGNVFIGLLKTGEASGTLDENLSFLSSWLERDSDLKTKLKAAMLYPKIVLTATVILAGGLVTFILPKLVPLFSQLRVALPLSTRILIATSLFFGTYWILVAIVIVGLIITFQALQRVKPARRFFDGIYLRTPFFSGLFKGYELALISQLLSTLVKGGLSINEALGVAAEAATNVCYEDSLVVIQDRVAKGVTISEAMREYPQLYPVNMVVIIAAAEKSGSLEESLAHLAEFYSKEVDNKTKSLPTVLEPLMLIFIGLIVSLIALSIISPIYDLVQSLQK